MPRNSDFCLEFTVLKYGWEFRFLIVLHSTGRTLRNLIWRFAVLMVPFLLMNEKGIQDWAKTYLSIKLSIILDLLVAHRTSRLHKVEKWFGCILNLSWNNGQRSPDILLQSYLNEVFGGSIMVVHKINCSFAFDMICVGSITFLLRVKLFWLPISAWSSHKTAVLIT